MAMSAGKEDGEPMMEMNTTPLIDVMLVLLIMFIITIPPSTDAVKIDLPVPNNEPTDPEVDPVRNKIIILDDDTVQWNGDPVSQQQLKNLMTEAISMNPQPEIQFQPSPIARYEIVDFTLATVREAEPQAFGFVGNEFYGNFGKGPSFSAGGGGE